MKKEKEDIVCTDRDCHLARERHCEGLWDVVNPPASTGWTWSSLAGARHREDSLRAVVIL